MESGIDKIMPENAKGMFTIKSLVIHKVTFRFLFKYLLKRAVTKIEDWFFRPVRITVNTVFVVGCGHSGTTLLAAKLGRHNDILSIGKESNLFLPYKNSLYMSSRILAEWQDFALSDKKQCVLEKTPKHLYCVDRISKVAPDHKMVAMIRNPLDTVSSLNKRFHDLDLCIDRWINDNNQVLALAEKEQVLVVRFEDLTMSPEKVFGEVCRFAGLSYDPAILDAGETAYLDNETTSSNMRVRSRQVSRKITQNIDGWKASLSEDQARYVIQRTRVVAEKLGYALRDEPGGPLG